jgi:menaquinone-dependent protoporphyrinogen IX oxidase
MRMSAYMQVCVCMDARTQYARLHYRVYMFVKQVCMHLHVRPFAYLSVSMHVRV